MSQADDFEQGVRVEHEDSDGCCECGSKEHTCQDCPTFTGDVE